MGYSILLWILVMALPGGFAALFTSDAQLMEYTKTALRIYMGSMFLFGIQMACQMTFNALGKAAESIIVAVMFTVQFKKTLKNMPQAAAGYKS